MDDVMIFGRNQQEHDARLDAALQAIRSAGVTLNRDKCKFYQDRITFLGHVIDRNGITADPQKKRAVVVMEKPQNHTELRRFMGMVNQLSKFTPNIAEFSQALHELLSTQGS